MANNRFVFVNVCRRIVFAVYLVKVAIGYNSF